jgi:hypothetical protein
MRGEGRIIQPLQGCMEVGGTWMDARIIEPRWGSATRIFSTMFCGNPKVCVEWYGVGC